MNTREQRLVENQRAFRTGNERLRDALGTAAGDESIPFLCECMDDACMARVDLTLEEYGGVRADESRFVIARDHPTLPGEKIVGDNGHYQVVEK